MSDISTILREKQENQNDEILFKPNYQNEKINKEIFFVHNELNKNPNNEKLITKKKSVNKENTISKNKEKIIHPNKKIIRTTTLNFDKILNILHNQNKENLGKNEKKKKKLLSHKRQRKNKEIRENLSLLSKIKVI